MAQSFVVNFANVQDREAIPAGDYVLELVEASLKVSNGEKTKGMQMLNLHWKVIGGEFDNSRVFDNLMLGGDALWKTKQLFVALFGKGQSQFEMNCEELAGSTVAAKITQEVWAEENGGDGETRNRIGRYKHLPDGGGGAASLDDLFAG